MAPVIWALNSRQNKWNAVNVCSSQHTDLLKPFVRQLNIDVHHDLNVMSKHQTPTTVLSRVVNGMQTILEARRPEMVLVQGDTTTALAGALAASYAGIPVGHVEAGLRTGNRHSPFPEELNRRLIAQTADLHFTATRANAESLVREGIDPEHIEKTGNPVIDSLKYILTNSSPSEDLQNLLNPLKNRRVLVLTTHRRENFGAIMQNHMKTIRSFIDRHDDIVVVFPVHPNPNVRDMAYRELSGHDRIKLVEPFEYSDFIHLLSKAWLIASDSGGIVEEAPTLGKPVIVLRDTTERPEAVECGIARLAGYSSQLLEKLLDKASATEEWSDAARHVINPFGSGDAGFRIVSAITRYFDDRETVSHLESPTRDPLQTRQARP